MQETKLYQRGACMWPGNINIHAAAFILDEFIRKISDVFIFLCV
jgi:hypothetical protein